jgi:hypothetical protein
MEIPTSIERVPTHTAQSVNDKIQRDTEIRVHYFSQYPDEIDERLDDLDREWDIERALETNAAALAFGGTVLGILGKKTWLLGPLAVTGFLLQHGIKGWCPPLPLLRRLGFRTAREIEAERYALKALRGDFEDTSSKEDGADIAVRATHRVFNGAG